jgi:hypothetical protein
VKGLPADPAAEEALIGAALLDVGAAATVAELGAAAFYVPRHQRIVAAITEVIEGGQLVDVITVAARLDGGGALEEAGGVEFLHGLQNMTPATSRAVTYAGIVRGLARRREYVYAADDISGAAMRGDEARLSDLLIGRLATIEPPGGYVPPDVEAAWQRLRAGANPAPPPTLLERTDGHGLLHAGASHLLFGRGGAGKTMLVQRAYTSGPMLDRPVGWVDLDNMGFDPLVARAAQLGVGDVMLTSKTLRYYDQSAYGDLASLTLALAREQADGYVFDSMIGLLVMAGIDGEEKNAAIRAAMDRPIRQLRRGREEHPPSVTFIDHTGLQPGRPRGATGKIDAVDQAVEVVVVSALGRDRVGRLRLVSRKDRRGYWPDGMTIADVVIDGTEPMTRPLEHLGNRIDVKCYPPASRAAMSRDHMEAISLAVEAADPAGGDVRWSNVRKQAPISNYSNDEQKSARDELVRLGHIEEARLGSAANAPILLRLVRPFRASDPDEGET